MTSSRITVGFLHYFFFRLLLSTTIDFCSLLLNCYGPWNDVLGSVLGADSVPNRGPGPTTTTATIGQTAWEAGELQLPAGWLQPIIL